MKLSELVAFRNQLELASMEQTKLAMNLDVGQVQYLMQNYSHGWTQLSQQIDHQKNTIQQQIELFESTLTQLKQQIKLTIAEQEKYWFAESYRLYEHGMPNETTQYILDRREELPDDVQQVLLSRLENHADWRFPGMIIRPGKEKFTRGMVANDPLYLIDQHYDLLIPAMEQFPEAYQNRLRTYVVNERATNPILHKIPNAQFGLCLAYNFFNFRPFEVIKQWLLEIQTKLRPGGVLIMTINDCDREKAVMLVENHFACYTPGYLILDLVTSMGFEIISTWNNDGPSTWIELRNPGTLTSLRGGQTLAKIVDKGLANSK